MATNRAITGIRTLPAADLQREIRLRKMALAKHALGVHMGSEKDTSKLKKERREIARMMTVAHELQHAGLKNAAESPTVSAPSSAKSRTPRKKASSSKS